MTNLGARLSLSTAILISGMHRMTWFFLVLLLSGSIISCEKEKLPDGVLDHQKFSAVLVDIYLAQSRLNASLAKRDSADLLFKPFEEKLLQLHHTSDSVMKKTYEYYIAHPKELELIYDSVIDTLSLREQKAKPPEAKK
jgi:Domain of unknown function (DUF4296)